MPIFKNVTENSSGNVGIGTTNPTYRVSTLGTGDHRIYHYNSGTTTSDNAIIQAEVAGDNSGNAFFCAGKTGLVWSFGRNTSTGNFEIRSNFNLANDASSRMIITSTGAVGVGTTAPAHKFQIGSAPFSAAQFGVGNDTGQGMVLLMSSTVSEFITNTNFAFTGISGNGYVGIGTTNPGSTLDVLGGAIVRGSNGSGAISVGTSSGRGQYQYINLGGTTGGTDYGWQIGRSPNTGGIINDGFYIYDIKTNNAPFTIALGGSVGIGTTNPKAKLHVFGDASLEPASGGNSYKLYFTDDHNSHYIYSNGYWIDIVGNENEMFRVQKRNSDGSLTEYMRMTGAGNLGIGTTNPGSYKLYVQGDQYISGTLTEASSITLKENINPITDALSIIKNITGYTYDRKDGTAINQSGLIAEEVAEILPGVVSRDQEGNPSGVQYTKIIAYLVESIKELKSELDELKRQ